MRFLLLLLFRGRKLITLPITSPYLFPLKLFFIPFHFFI